MLLRVTLHITSRRSSFLPFPAKVNQRTKLPAIHIQAHHKRVTGSLPATPVQRIRGILAHLHTAKDDAVDALRRAGPQLDIIPRVIIKVV
jgi:hypothetical protein